MIIITNFSQIMEEHQRQKHRPGVPRRRSRRLAARAPVRQHEMVRRSQSATARRETVSVYLLIIYNHKPLGLKVIIYNYKQFTSTIIYIYIVYTKFGHFFYSWLFVLLLPRLVPILSCFPPPHHPMFSLVLLLLFSGYFLLAISFK